jgi:CRISPR-associated endonuclease/helicase Cas3
LVSGRRRSICEGGEVSTEDDRASSFTGVEVSLERHLAGVADTAGEFADRVGLPAEVAADVRLAGRWHDVGKADPRFQRLLHGGSEFKTLVAPEPLAKSAVPMNDRRARRRARERSGYPGGSRHEVMSVALMAGAGAELAPHANDWELVLHLVGSHHGRCRPLAPWVPDPEPVEVTWELDRVLLAGSSGHGLARLDSGVAERFWRLVRRYGWWGLAWLEAILRLGDQRRSEEEQTQPGGAA